MDGIVLEKSFDSMNTRHDSWGMPQGGRDDTGYHTTLKNLTNNCLNSDKFENVNYVARAIKDIRRMISGLFGYAHVFTKLNMTHLYNFYAFQLYVAVGTAPWR